MTYRVYVRWPGQKTSDKTSTDSELVAYTAYDELADARERLRADGALGVSMSQDNKNVRYLELNTGS